MFDKIRPQRRAQEHTADFASNGAGRPLDKTRGLPPRQAMRRRIDSCLAGVIAGTLLAACASSPTPERPDVGFLDIVEDRVPEFSLLDVIDDDGRPVTAQPASESQPVGVDAEQAKARFMPVFAAEATRVIDREAKAIGRKKPAEVGEWAEKWYEGQRAAIASAMTPPCVSLGAFVGVGYRDAEAVAIEYAERHVAESRRLLSSAGGDVSTELERWRIERPAMIAQHLTDEVCHARS